MSFLIILHLTKTRFCLFSIWSNFFSAYFRFMLAFAIEIRRKVLISSKKILFSESILLKKEYVLICFLAEKHWEIELFLPLNSLSRLYSFLVLNYTSIEINPRCKDGVFAGLNMNICSIALTLMLMFAFWFLTLISIIYDLKEILQLKYRS